MHAVICSAFMPLIALRAAVTVGTAWLEQAMSVRPIRLMTSEFLIPNIPMFLYAKPPAKHSGDWGRESPPASQTAPCYSTSIAAQWRHCRLFVRRGAQPNDRQWRPWQADDVEADRRRPVCTGKATFRDTNGEGDLIAFKTRVLQLDTTSRARLTLLRTDTVRRCTAMRLFMSLRVNACRQPGGRCNVSDGNSPKAELY
jgi:hypothetical protein